MARRFADEVIRPVAAALDRDAKITRIDEGAGQIQRMIIARECLTQGAAA